MTPLPKGTRVERLASPHKYGVPVGTRGVIMRVYDAPNVGAYDVLWSLEDRELVLFSAGALLREVDDAAASG